VTDTRESNPLDLSPLKTERYKLDTGDYSVKTLENRVTVEVKEIGDFINCCTFERERFERELARMRDFTHKAIVIKGDWSTIVMKQYRSNTAPLAVLGSAMSFAMSANVSIIMAGDHKTAGQLVARLLWVSANQIHRQKNS
jgi:ERCC4-type nuclease